MQGCQLPTEGEKPACTHSRKAAASLSPSLTQVNDQGYPWVLGRNEVAAGQKIIITTRDGAVASESVLPIMCVHADHFTCVPHVDHAIASIVHLTHRPRCQHRRRPFVTMLP
jgi:hypothetical protein